MLAFLLFSSASVSQSPKVSLACEMVDFPASGLYFDFFLPFGISLDPCDPGKRIRIVVIKRAVPTEMAVLLCSQTSMIPDHINGRTAILFAFFCIGCLMIVASQIHEPLLHSCDVVWLTPCIHTHYLNAHSNLVTPLVVWWVPVAIDCHHHLDMLSSFEPLENSDVSAILSWAQWRVVISHV